MFKVKAQDEVQEKAAAPLSLKRSMTIPDKMSNPQRLARMPIKESFSEEGADDSTGRPERAVTMRRIQCTVGNTAAVRLAASPVPSSLPPAKNLVQSKLRIGQPGDMYEREADAAASHISAGMPVDQVSRMTSSDFRQRMNSRPEEEEVENVQRLESEESSPEKKADVDTAEKAISKSCAGAPLCPRLQKQMEESFGADFSDVRVHTEDAAQEAAQSLNARAFTAGQDIYFGHGQYRPEASDGQRLLAHELTHVVQQNASSVRAPSGQGQALQGTNRPSQDLKSPIQQAAEVYLKSANLSIQRHILLRQGGEGTEHSPIFGWPEFVDQVSSGEYPSTSLTPEQTVGLRASYARPTEQIMSAFGNRPALAAGILSGMDATGENFVFDTPAEIAADVVRRMQFLDEFMDDVNDIDAEPIVDQSTADLIGYAVYEIMPFEASEYIDSEYNRAPRHEDWDPLLVTIFRRIATAQSLWTQFTLEQRMLYVMELLVNVYRFPVVGAAAIVGNLRAESTVLPNPRGRVLRRPSPPRGAAGLVQWTPRGGRQAGLFQHQFHGRQLGAAILLDMDAQVDYMVNELRTRYRGVYTQVMGATTDSQLNAAADRVTIRYETPRAAMLPPQSVSHQRELRARRVFARTALRVYRAAHP